MIMSTIQLVLGLCVLYVSYTIYQVPVPPGVKHPWELRKALAVNILCFRIFDFLDWLGLVKDYEAQRWLGRLRSSESVQGVDTRDVVLDGVPVRVFTPHGVTTEGRGMVYYHGGGWVLGSVTSSNRRAAYLAQQTEMVVMSVEYRLAPEFSKADGLDDCVVATKHVIRKAADFGIDPERVVIGGDSAGGANTASVALRLRDDGFTPMPRLQLLHVPVLQMVDLQLPSYQQNSNGPHLTTDRMNWFFSFTLTRDKSYMQHLKANTHVTRDVRQAVAEGTLNHDLLPDTNKYPPYKKPDYQGSDVIWEKISSIITDPYEYPLMAKNLSNLPEAFIFTAQYDVLRDDGYLYAHHLRQAGVVVTHYNCPYGWHTMGNYVHMDDVKATLDEVMAVVKSKLSSN